MTTRMIRLVLVAKHLTKVQGQGGGIHGSLFWNTVSCTSSRTSTTRMMSAVCSGPVQDQAKDTLEQFHYRLQHLNSMKDSEEVASATSAQRATLHDLAERFYQHYHDLPPLKKLTADSSDDCERKQVLEYLALECIPTEATVATAVAHYHQVLGESADGNLENDTSPRDDSNHHLRTSHAMARLRDACEPQYERILRTLLEQNTKQGMQLLFSLRRDLLQLLADLKKHQQQQHTPPIGNNKEAEWLLMHNLKQMDQFLLQTFTTWFAPGLLQVQRITYDATPAAIM
jgi:Malonyl-CoA decarboxylase N-terminal domain